MSFGTAKAVPFPIFPYAGAGGHSAVFSRLEVRCVQVRRSIECAGQRSNWKFQFRMDSEKGTFAYVPSNFPVAASSLSVVWLVWPSRTSSDAQTSKNHDEECLGIGRPDESSLSLLAWGCSCRSRA